MITENIDLYAYFGKTRPDGARGYLTAYVQFQSPEYCTGRLRPAMVVIPGGGYAMTSDREREPIALAYLAEGFDCFTLDYSVSPIRFPYQLLEGAMAVAYVRENAQKYNVDPEHIAVIGFSAGGHLAGMLATMSRDEEIVKFLGKSAQFCTPNGAILSYPVITSGESSEVGSIENLSGGNTLIREKISLEKRVDDKSVPAFIWATADDDDVPSENSLLMAFAYRKAGIPFELHIFEHGRHGLSLANEQTGTKKAGCLINDEVAQWFSLSVRWLKKRGFSVKI